MQEQISNRGEFSGLAESEIPALLSQYGKNIFESDKDGGFFRTVWNLFKEPMFLLLVFACALYFILGESKEGLLMFAALLFVGAISVYQELKSSRALAMLKQYTEPKIIVVRDGSEKIIESENLLPGDIMKLEEGNRIPADAILLQSNDFTVDESVVTGESVPVERKEGPVTGKILQGTTINSGKAHARVTETGNHTVLGKLGKSINAISGSKTLLQQQIGKFVKIMAILGFTAFAIIWFVNYLHSKDILQSLLLGLTLAMSVIPEEIPVAFSSFMALGASQMAKLGIITRQPQTIENLGAVSVVCIDKTGTITENKMQVKKIYDYEQDMIETLEQGKSMQGIQLMRYAMLASESDPFDAMEKAIVKAYLEGTGSEVKSYLKIIHEYPLEGQPPMMTHVYDEHGMKIIAAKGAPERILRICKLDEITTNKLRTIVKELASQGYRVLGVSSADGHSGPYPDRQDDFRWTFKGFLALYDPPKQNINEVFVKWYSAGIEIKLLTGDYAETAMNIASLVGIKKHSEYITGEEVMKLAPEELRNSVKRINIYARMYPEAKLKIINVLKDNQEIVAMTGDGVNDGPALKSAQIGIAMGHNGTEIAKDSADLVITDDHVERITDAIQQGRKIYNNLKKAIRYIISIHIPIILTASMPVLLGWKYPNIFSPIHIIFLELIMGPTCSIFYEQEPMEANLMNKPPRPHQQNMFSTKELSLSIVQGMIITLGLFSFYYFLMGRQYPIAYVRTAVFTTLILSNISLTFMNRSFEEIFIKTIHYRNRLAPYVILISAIFLGVILFVKPIRNVFQLTTLSSAHYFICVGISLVCTVWVDVYKLLLNKPKQ
jgi:Ca2+-transporting ATPase